ncbi:acetyl-coenzyme A synthetase-like isoform X2 [Corticium candelabrum]|uniref:acetyl-coenzyme A synthetase-like isoform X2 n=1 Tax=Corticium candelabrum TaxID=121492 RepID=UPI002E25EC4A|nr:acetyl-coenzyme A synthetase-like isoform X2 [Corticium candelabrum]
MSSQCNVEMTSQNHNTGCTFLISYTPSSDAEDEWMTNLSTCLLEKRIDVKQLPLSASENEAGMKHHDKITFCFWICVITKRFLTRHDCLASVHKIFLELAKTSKSNFRILPLLLVSDLQEKEQLKERFRQLLPNLWNRRPIITTLEKQSAARIASIVFQTSKRDGSNNKGCCCSRLQLTDSDLCLSDVQLKGVDALWNSNKREVPLHKTNNVLGLSLAHLRDATGEAKSCFVYQSDTVNPGCRILGINDESVESSDVIRCLKYHPNGTVRLIVQDPVDDFDMKLTELKDFTLSIQSMSTVQGISERPSWLQNEKMSFSEDTQLRSAVSDSSAVSSHCKDDKRLAVHIMTAKEIANHKANNSVVYLLGPLADKGLGEDTNSQEAKPEFLQLQDYGSSQGEPKIKELLEAASLKGLSMQEYKLLHKFSLDHPEIFWRQLAQDFVFDVDSKDLDVECDPLRAFKTGHGPKTSFLSKHKTNMCFNMLDRNVARGLGDRCALKFVETDGNCISVSYKELLHRVCVVTKRLQHAGVKTGDKVLVFMKKSVERILVVLACFRIAAPVCVLYPDGADDDELKQNAELSKCTVIITSNAVMPRKVDFTMLDYILEITEINNEARSGKETSMEVGCLLVWIDPAQPPSLLSEPRKYPSNILVALLNEDDAERGKDLVTGTDACFVLGEHPLFLASTSGSTGNPKTVEHSTAGYMVYTAVSFKYLLDFNLEGKPTYVEDGSDVCLATADLGWCYGMSIGLCGPLLNGGTTVQVCRPSTEKLIEIVKDTRVTHLCTVPETTRDFVRNAGETDNWKISNGSKLEVICSCGTLLTDRLTNEVRNYFESTGIRLTDVWWQTETGCFMLGTASKITVKYSKRLLPFYGIDAEIKIDPKLHVQDDRKQGELVIAKPWPSCFRAIYSKDKHDYADEEAFEDGYYMTGDNALQNCDGTFQLLGRNDSIILMSTADRQIFMTHREQMSATVEDVASEIFPNQPCHRAVMRVKMARISLLLFKSQRKLMSLMQVTTAVMRPLKKCCLNEL